MRPHSDAYLRFFVMILLISILNLILHLVLDAIFSFILITGILFNILYYLVFALFTVLSIITSVSVVHHFFPLDKASETQKDSGSISNSLRLNKDRGNKPPFKAVLFSGISTKSFPMQLRDGMLLLVCVYVPLDFLSYCIPGVLSFSANAFNAADTSNPNNYFQYSLLLMLITAVGMHLIIAIREEFLYREFFLTEGRQNFGTPYIFFLNAFLFGMAHFNYIFNSAIQGSSPIYPVIWAINGLIIGLVSGAYFWKKRQLIPIIVAHWLNNVISAIVVRNAAMGNSFWQISVLYIYLPVLTLAFVFYITKLFDIRSILQTISKNWRDYISEVSRWKQFAIDALFAILLWIVMIVA